MDHSVATSDFPSLSFLNRHQKIRDFSSPSFSAPPPGSRCVFVYLFFREIAHHKRAHKNRLWDHHHHPPQKTAIPIVISISRWQRMTFCCLRRSALVCLHPTGFRVSFLSHVCSALLKTDISQYQLKASQDLGICFKDAFISESKHMMKEYVTVLMSNFFCGGKGLKSA